VTTLRARGQQDLLVPQKPFRCASEWRHADQRTTPSRCVTEEPHLAGAVAEAAKTAEPAKTAKTGRQLARVASFAERRTGPRDAAKSRLTVHREAIVRAGFSERTRALAEASVTAGEARGATGQVAMFSEIDPASVEQLSSVGARLYVELTVGRERMATIRVERCQVLVCTALPLRRSR